MFIRRTRTRSRDGSEYFTYRLVESERVGERVRQRTLLNLGRHFDVPREHWPALVTAIERRRSGQDGLWDPALPQVYQALAERYAAQLLERQGKAEQQAPTESAFAEVDLDSLELARGRCVAGEHVALAATRELGLDDKLAELGFNGPQQAAALGNIIARMLAPASERASAQWLARDSGLGELIGYEFESMSLHRLYDASDRLLRHKAALEAHLYERECTLFDLGDTITLYDLTNTFFEGDARANELATRGHSKDKRHDRCLVTLGLVLDSDGFPKRSEIFAGNAGEAATLAQMLDGLGAPAGSTVVVDAGIASQANLEWLVAQGYHYLVVTRQRRGEIDAELAETLTTRGGETLRVQRELDDDTGEVLVYCESPRRREKEQAMQQRSGERFEQGLRQIKEGLHKKGGTKRYDKVVERLGRLKERHARAAQHYRVHIERDGATDKACSIDWEYAPAGASRATHPGVYCLRSDLTDWSEAALWRTYTLLTDVEEAFRSLKSELGLRPIHHQTSERVRAHLFISVLAYHLVHTIRFRLKAHGINERWATLRAQLASQRRVTATLNDRDGSTWHIRKAMRPEPEERAIYDALGLDHHPGTTLKQRVA